jgi:hypothetical protein
MIPDLPATGPADGMLWGGYPQGRPVHVWLQGANGVHILHGEEAKGPIQPDPPSPIGISQLFERGFSGAVNQVTEIE